MDNNTQIEAFWAEITSLIEYFRSIPAPRLFETLEIGHLRGRNGQIYVVSRQTYEAQKKAKTKQPKPPKIQFFLDQATSWKTLLEQDPSLTHTQLGMKFALSRSEVIHTLNLLNLPNQAKQFIRKIPPSITHCPLTKKKLRPITETQNESVRLLMFKELVLKLFKNDPDTIALLNETLGQENQPIANRTDIPIINTDPVEPNAFDHAKAAIQKEELNDRGNSSQI